MDLAQNNLNTQIELMKDIIQNDHNIFYHVKEKGVKLIAILRAGTSTKNDDNTYTYSFTKEQFNELEDIAFALSSDEKFVKLGILAKDAVPDNVIKKKILDSLRKP